MKFSGKIGFWEEDVEEDPIKSPGVFTSKIMERSYQGDVLQNRRTWEHSDKQNMDISIRNRITIVSDLYARSHWPSIKYVLWNGIKWRVTDITVDYPIITLEIGGEYNGIE